MPLHQAASHLAAAGLAAIVAGWVACSNGTVEARVEVSDLAASGAFGRFLEDAPPLADRDAPRTRRRRPSHTDSFAARYERIAVSRDEHERDLVLGSLLAAPPREGARFAFDCRGAQARELETWVFTRRGHAGGDLEFRSARGRVRASLDAPGNRLLRVRSALPAGFCAGKDEDELVLHLPGEAANRWILGLPALLAEDDGGRPSVVVISLDTLRADRWRDASERPASLEALRRDSVVFERAFSAFPTTDTSHSVLFSGLAPQRAVRRPLDGRLSWVSGLSAAGYATLGFVAGGHMRAVRGFGGRPPGFALGFDLYLEEMSLRDQPPPGDSVLALERRKQTHTLGPALERSLRWFAEHPGELALHFIHGFDVHEYRSVARPWWEATVAAHAARGGDPEEVGRCANEVGAALDDEYVVHFPNEMLFRVRQTGQLGALERCHRLLGDLLYEARVRSVEAMLGSYFDGLRALGVYDRALVVVTSDHGESLLDEPDWNGDSAWGHNRILANNLAVPLWLKLPGAARAGERVTRPVGLVDLRATLAAALRLDLGSGDGVDALAGEGERPSPLAFASNDDGYGFVLADGGLCAWRGAGGDPERSRRFRDGAWSERADPDAACEELRRVAGRPEPAPVAPIPAELQRELRELGYAE